MKVSINKSKLNEVLLFLSRICNKTSHLDLFKSVSIQAAEGELSMTVTGRANWHGQWRSEGNDFDIEKEGACAVILSNLIDYLKLSKGKVITFETSKTRVVISEDIGKTSIRLPIEGYNPIGDNDLVELPQYATISKIKIDSDYFDDLVRIASFTSDEKGESYMPIFKNIWIYQGKCIAIRDRNLCSFIEGINFPFELKNTMFIEGAAIKAIRGYTSEGVEIEICDRILEYVDGKNPKDYLIRTGEYVISFRIEYHNSKNFEPALDGFMKADYETYIDTSIKELKKGLQAIKIGKFHVALKLSIRKGKAIMKAVTLENEDLGGTYNIEGKTEGIVRTATLSIDYVSAILNNLNSKENVRVGFSNIGETSTPKLLLIIEQSGLKLTMRCFI